MKIRDVMLKPVFLSPDMDKNKIFSIVKDNPGTELFIVTDDEKRFLGDITVEDLFLMLLPNEHYDDIGVDLALDMEKKFFANTAHEIMRKHDFTCSTDDEVLDVSLRLAGLEVNEMPVIDKDKKVVGYVTEGSLIRYLM